VTGHRDKQRNDANRVDNDKERNEIVEELVRHAAAGAIFY
jgi:flagellar basal body rod protein FlgB